MRTSAAIRVMSTSRSSSATLNRPPAARRRGRALRPPRLPGGDQVGRLGDHQRRDDQLVGGGLQPDQACPMVGVVIVGQRVEHAGVDEDHDAARPPSSARRISSALVEVSARPVWTEPTNPGTAVPCARAVGAVSAVAARRSCSAAASSSWSTSSCRRSRVVMNPSVPEPSHHRPLAPRPWHPDQPGPPLPPPAVCPALALEAGPMPPQAVEYGERQLTARGCGKCRACVLDPGHLGVGRHPA